MRYIISDIHGCYTEYMELLDKIRFSDSDTLYILGDSVDRGPEPIKVLQDMIYRPNIIYIIGNHDYMMLTVLRKLAVEITEENSETHLSLVDMMEFTHWMSEGGDITVEQFRKLSREEQEDILEFLEEALIYDTIEDGDERYILAHAGIQNFEKEKELEDYDYTDFIFGRIDYNRNYFEKENVFLVTGHTPTALIRKDRKPLIYCEQGHIALDCGCVFGGKLAAYCVETGEAIYIDSKSR